VFKAQLQLSLLETQIVQLERERRLREAELNSLLNRPSNAPLGKPSEPHVHPLTKTLEELQTAARDHSPLLQRDQKSAEKASMALNLARKDYYPDYAITGGYFNMAGLPAFYSFRADIKIPLYFRSKQRAAVTEQAQMATEARHAFAATGQTLDAKVAEDYLLADTSQQLLDLYLKTVIPQARLAADAGLAAYETGAVDFLSTLNNYVAALEFEMSYHEQMLNYHVALSRLEETAGVRLIEGDPQ
jgi:outer membrane protein TolC